MKKVNEIFMYSLGALIVLGFFATLICSVIFPIPPENSHIINILIGAEIGAFTGVAGFFFGSSMGSKQKTEIMSNSIKQ